MDFQPKFHDNPGQCTPGNAVDIRCEESDCEAQFSSWDNLNKHVKRCHEKQLYTCHIPGCKAEFRKHRLLKEHKLEVHAQRTKYLCQEPGCGKSFSLGHQYKRHLKTHEGYVCSECNEKFDKWSLLLKHRKRQHLNSCVHKCDKCQKTFTQKQWLTQHLRVHESTRTVVVCPYENCDREYLDQRNLNAHVRSYHEGKKFTCDHDGCNRSFATKLHQNLHDPNRPLPKVRVASEELMNNMRREITTFKDSLHSAATASESGQISLEFFQRKRVRWPFQTECIPWEVWNVKLNVISLNNEHVNRETMTEKVLYIAEVMNRHEYLPKMPNQLEVDLIFDTSYVDVQPYLHRVSYQINGPSSSSVSTTIREVS